MSLRGTLFLLPLLLTGCMVGPKYKVPPTPAPPAYKESSPADYKANDGWKPGQPADAPL